MKGTGSQPLPAQSIGPQIQITHKKMFVEELLKGITCWRLKVSIFTMKYFER